jgi:predicted dehydrogenase
VNKALVIGLGMGQQYALWLAELGYNVFTVDTNIDKGADYSDLSFAIAEHDKFDVVYIGTPNWTHEIIAKQVAAHSKLVLIEKPGVKLSSGWKQLVESFPETRIMMVKNNQFRPELKLFKQQSDNSTTVYVRWNNANRIPHPGSWFTTRSKAFGGVSRDLMPHMLSYYCAMTDYKQGAKIKATASQQYKLEDIHNTDYGVVDKNGIYDVDDFCRIEFKNGKTTWILTANWKTNLDHDDSSISFENNSSAVRHELGLCPGAAYKAMITQATNNLNNDEFWQEQLEQDMWIHQQIEFL